MRLRRVRAAVFSAREHGRMQPERAVEAEGVGVGQQFGGVETLPLRRIIGSLNPESIAGAGAESWCATSKRSIGVAGHRGAKDLAVALVKAKGDALGVRQHERCLEPMRRDDDPEARVHIAHAAAGGAIER